MPFTMNGVGTSVSGSRGDIGWGSHDAMECFVIFFMPIFPYKALHTFDWNGEQYRAIPIRWSWDLVFRTYVRPWSWGLIAVAAVLCFICILEMNKGKGNLMVLLPVGAVLFGLGVLGHLLLHYTDRRHKAIRRVIGGLTIGTCDPANLKGDILRQMTGDTKMLYGTETFAAAVEPQLAKGALAQAMWAARMAVAVEERREGERLTDMLLNDPRVAAAIEEVRRTPTSWGKVMLTPEQSQEVEEAQRLDVRAPGAHAMPAKSAAEEDETRVKGKRRRDDEDY